MKTLGCFCILMYFLERSGCFVVWHYISLKELGCLSYCMYLFENFWIFCLKDWDVSFSCNVYPWKRWDVLLYSNVFLWKHWDVLLYYNVCLWKHWDFLYLNVFHWKHWDVFLYHNVFPWKIGTFCCMTLYFLDVWSLAAPAGPNPGPLVSRFRSLSGLEEGKLVAGPWGDLSSDLHNLLREAFKNVLAEFVR